MSIGPVARSSSPRPGTHLGQAPMRGPTEPPVPGEGGAKEEDGAAPGGTHLRAASRGEKGQERVGTGGPGSLHSQAWGLTAMLGTHL